jgi:hypothetical protein
VFRGHFGCFEAVIGGPSTVWLELRLGKRGIGPKTRCSNLKAHAHFQRCPVQASVGLRRSDHRAQSGF